MKILLPWRNLGCLGFKFKSGLYVDIWKGFDGKYKGIFIRGKNAKIWVTFSGAVTVKEYVPLNRKLHELGKEEGDVETPSAG